MSRIPSLIPSRNPGKRHASCHVAMRDGHSLPKGGVLSRIRTAWVASSSLPGCVPASMCASPLTERQSLRPVRGPVRMSVTWCMKVT